MDLSHVRNAFKMWIEFVKTNGEISYTYYHVPPGMQSAFQEVALHGELEVVFEIGAEFGFAEESISNILILHGGYFRLLQSGMIDMARCRYIDSLYHPTFPSLGYCLKNKKVLAPWVTLGAQEALLDLPLSEMGVIEYGSGISTFFFHENSKMVVSFEDDSDPAPGFSWLENMSKAADHVGASLNLYKPGSGMDLPINAFDLVPDCDKILVFIDGLDRDFYFREWALFIQRNRTQPIVLVVDNSELSNFEQYFRDLYQLGALIVHHYGQCYGQLQGKQCTSFVTFDQSLLVERSPSPASHDKRWGSMNFQA